jgi:transcriptional regulator with XRE-family HTH domain
MSTIDDLARNVRSERERLGWSQEQLAEQSGIHRTYVSGVERGRRNPTITVLAALANALGTSPSALLGSRK